MEGKKIKMYSNFLRNLEYKFKQTIKKKKDDIDLNTYHEQEQQQHQQKQQAFEAWSLCEGDELSRSCWLEGIFEGVDCWRRDRLLS